MNIKTTLILSVTLALTSLSYAKTTKQPVVVSKEHRTKMAEMHEKMAECLKSDKSFNDCHKEMWQTCQSGGMQSECPMMGKGMHSMMMDSTPTKSPEKQEASKTEKR